jgi:hypothetical protein
MTITRNWKIAITVSAIVVAGIAGFSFINYRKKRIRNVSKLYLGVEETGNNQGFNNAVFEKMMREVGWTSNAQWCSFFAKMVVANALPNLRDDIDKWFSGNSQATYNNVANGKSDKFEIVKNGLPKKGDVIIWQTKGNTSTGHVGIVIKTYLGQPHKFLAVEGNTNYDPEFNGDGQLVDTVPHNTKVGEQDSLYKSKILRGFIRLK